MTLSRTSDEPVAEELSRPVESESEALISSLWFLKSRRDGQSAKAALEAALAEITTTPSVADIKGLTSLTETRTLLHGLLRQQNRILNFAVSYSRTHTRLAPFSLMQEKIFFAIRNVFRLKRNLPDQIYPYKDIAREILLQRAAESIREAFRICCHTEQERARLMKELAEEVSIEPITVRTSEMETRDQPDRRKFLQFRNFYDRSSFTGELVRFHEDPDVDFTGTCILSVPESYLAAIPDLVSRFNPLISDTIVVTEEDFPLNDRRHYQQSQEKWRGFVAEFKRHRPKPIPA